MPYAEVYPLVTARALARPFTYRVSEEVVRGDVWSVGLGGRRVRGVVVDVMRGILRQGVERLRVHGRRLTTDGAGHGGVVLGGGRAQALDRRLVHDPAAGDEADDGGRALT